MELDEARRELRLDGAPVALQPRVFDLLVTLFHNRDRVMGKDELLDRLWPNVVVGDGSLQRAVSLARAALKPAGLDRAIRNYPRQGYRFCPEELAPDTLEESMSALERADTALAAAQWEAAIAAYGEADAETALDAVHLERYADACQCYGEAAHAESVLERAIAAYAAKGDRLGAARMALRLAEVAFEAGRKPVARGWLAQGRRHLEGEHRRFENGLEAYMSARLAMAAGDFDNARASARLALEIGQDRDDEDLQALGRVYLGFAALSLEQVELGLAQMDEAAAAVLAGAVSARVGGVIYCGLLSVCCNRGDWARAVQWSESFSRWCERGGMRRFSGLCQLHRAEVLSVSGEPDVAEAEIRSACEQVRCFSAFMEGDAYRILGDFEFLRGRLDEAGQAYRRAYEMGWDPQPGLALLQSECGDAESAVLSLQRSLDQRSWDLRQRRGLLLAHLAGIAARHGRRDLALSTLAELDAHPEYWTSEFHGAAVAWARAECATLEQRAVDAVSFMREAIHRWRQAGCRLNVANGLFRLAEILVGQGDHAGACFELDAAQASFEALNARERAGSCRLLRDSLPVA